MACDPVLAKSQKEFQVSPGQKSSLTVILAVPVILSVLVTLGACRQAPAEPRLLGRAAAMTKIREFLDRPLKLKVLSLTKFPSGPGYEIKQVDGPGYFVVDARAGDIDYAVLEDIKDKEGNGRLGLKKAESIARKWAASQRVFADFRYLEKQADREWPKSGYYTTVWAGRAPARSRREFAKVTVDLATGKVVSFGMGDPKWTIFCLPPGAVDNP